MRSASAATADVTTFVDTNVLVYVFDRADPGKQAIAADQLERLWAEHSGVLSTQILQEFYSVATNRLKLAMTPAEARQVVELYAEWPVTVIEPADILNASAIQERLQLSFWDALVLQSAIVAGADRLLTEDLQDGLEVEGVRIENPFLVAPNA
jgi:predicted nucleic acid-binding protein